LTIEKRCGIDSHIALLNLKRAVASIYWRLEREEWHRFTFPYFSVYFGYRKNIVIGIETNSTP
jgi:hypothetical protein